MLLRRKRILCLTRYPKMVGAAQAELRANAELAGVCKINLQTALRGTGAARRCFHHAQAAGCIHGKLRGPTSAVR